jgi:hypothetical protein
MTKKKVHIQGKEKSIDVKLDISLKDLDAIAREMTINGFRIENDNDPIFYWYLGSKTYHKMIGACTDFSILETRYLKHEPGTTEARHLYAMNKQRMWEAMYQSFPDLATRDFSHLDFNPKSDEEMMNEIRRRYERNP